MTFEEWLLEQGFKHPEFDLMVKRSEYALMKAAWNAAISAAQEELKKHEYYCWGPDVNVDYYSVFPDDHIDHLKSS